MLRPQNWLRNFKRAILRESIERDSSTRHREGRRPRFEPLEDRRVMAVAIEAFTPTPSGFTAQLSEEIRTDNLNLYDTEGGAMGAADVILRGDSVGDIRGTLVVRGTELSFVATGGILPPDNYTATLRSAPDAIVDAALGQMLDGEFTGQFPSGNGTPGGDFVFSFTVGAPPAVVVSLPDFARGPTQAVNVPAIGSGEAPLTGLPIRLNQTAGVTSMTMTITYDPDMLDVSEVKLGRDAPNGSQVEANLTVPGQITLAFFSLNPMTGGPADLLEIVATVPEDATYGQTQVLRIESVEVNAGVIQAIGDEAIHVVAFPGDANANRRYDAEDARLVARVGVGLDTGFVVNNPTATGPSDAARLYPTIDPIIIGDVTGLDGISPLDASDILRRVVGLATPNIPALPTAQAPTALALSSTAIAEGQSVGTVVGNFTTTDPDAGDTHTYSLISGAGDTDNQFFTISGSSLLTAAVFDAAVKSSYSIRVQTTDSTGRTLQRTFTISVTEGQAPTAIALSSTSVAENQPAGTVVGQLTTTDPTSGDTHTYTLVSGEGSSGNAAFQISGNALVTAAPLDFQQQSSYSVRVRSTDSTGLFTEEVFTITVTAVNEAPTGIVLSSSTVAEDQPAGTVVGTLSTNDPDAGDTHTYSIVAGEGDTDNASFAISGNDLVTTAPLDFDAQSSYSVRIRSTDEGGLFTEQVFVITLTGTNEAPTAISLSNNVIAENQAAGTVVGTLTTTDPDAGDTHTYSIVAGDGDTDNAAFAIVDNTLVTTEQFDAEAQSSLSVRVRSTDAGGLFTETAFVITVTSVGEAPSGIVLSSSTVGENQPAGTVVGSLSTIDPDAGDTHTYSIVAGEGDADNTLFAISGSDLVTTAPLDFDAQSSYSVRIRSTDESGLFVDHVFVITAEGTNETPTAIALSGSVVAENQPAGTVVGTFTTTDPDAEDSHAYSMVPGDGDSGNAFFAIVNETLVTAQSLDFEAQSSYSIRIRSTDSGGLFTEEVFVITVTDVNEAPTALTLSSTTVADDQPAGTVVGTFSTADPDAGDTHTYSIVAGEGDADNASFEIEGTALVTAEPLDFQQQSSYTVRVRTTDADGLFTEEVFVITEAGTNQAPTAVTLDNTTVGDNEPAGTLVGTLATTDPDAEDTHTYTLVEGDGDTDNDSFVILEGALLTAEELDFQQQSSYTVRIRSTDAGGLFTEEVFVITQTVGNQSPTAIILDNTEVSENAAAGTVVGTFTTTDPDAGDTHTYSLVAGEGDSDNASFTVDGATLVVAESLDFEAQSSYTVRIRSTDEGGLSTEEVFVITAAAAENQSPTAIAIDNTAVAQDAAVGTVVGSLTTTDPDAGDTHTYSIVAGEGDTDNASFAIDGASLVIAEALDFEAQSSYSVRVRSTDAGGLFTEDVFVITADTAENQSPTALALDSTTVAQDAAVGTVVGSLTTTDPDAGDTHTYSIVAGEGDTDNASFAIDGASLVIAEALDFEAQSSYSVRVRTTDAGGLFTEEVFVITADTAENQSPTTLALDSTTVAQDAAVGTVVGSFTTTDPDAGDTHTYSLVAGEGDTDNASFAIDGASLVIAEALDFEAQSSYSVRVRTTDADGLFTDEVFVITATATENVAPTAIAIDSTTVAPDASSGTVVGNFTTTDPNAGDTHGYSLVAGEGDSDNAFFTIDDDALLVLLPLDFEAQSSYSVRVRTTDAGGLFTEEVFVITAATAENQAPTQVTLDNATAPNMSLAGTVIGEFLTVDPDQDDQHQYLLVEGEGDTDNLSFVIVGDQLQAATTLDFGATPAFSVRVRSVDEGGLFVEQIFLITESTEQE